MKPKTLVVGLFIYLFSVGISYAVFSALSNRAPSSVSQPSQQQTSQTSLLQQNPDQALTFDQSSPKTETCPLNGVLYSKQQKDWWSKHRPLGVMIENHTEARPQSGLSYADVVYEAVAEGGITRFLSIFYCQDAGIVGPVRSARTYFVDYISEYGQNPLYAHVGGANTPGPANALGQIESYGWQNYNDMNQFSIPFPTYWQDKERLGHPVATEHTMYSTTTKLWDYAAKNRGLTNVDKNGISWDQTFVPYSFKDDVAASDRPKSQTVQFDFWSGYDDYGVKWVYDPKTNLYLRWNGGKPHMDRDTGKQLTTKNIVILFMTVQHANDGYTDNEHLLYATKGRGNALIFMDGKKISGTWSKPTRLSRTILKNANGQEIQFDRGKIWFELLEPTIQVTVE